LHELKVEPLIIGSNTAVFDIGSPQDTASTASEDEDDDVSDSHGQEMEAPGEEDCKGSLDAAAVTEDPDPVLPNEPGPAPGEEDRKGSLGAAAVTKDSVLPTSNEPGPVRPPAGEAEPHRMSVQENIDFFDSAQEETHGMAEQTSIRAHSPSDESTSTRPLDAAEALVLKLKISHVLGAWGAHPPRDESTSTRPLDAAEALVLKLKISHVLGVWG
jgi:hypothetical protein